MGLMASRFEKVCFSQLFWAEMYFSSPEKELKHPRHR
jgi:hypothetical protein